MAGRIDRWIMDTLGGKAWNAWRRRRGVSFETDFREASLFYANLSGADLSGLDLSRADLFEANLTGANLRGANLSGADLRNTNLRKVDFFEANLSRADLRGAVLFGANLGGADLTEANLGHAIFMKANLAAANLSMADLVGANLAEADLSMANLSKADLSMANLCKADLHGADLRGTKLGALLVGANLANANIKGCHVYGMSAWDLNLEGATQKDLVITRTMGGSQPEITVDNLEVAQFLYLLLNNERVRHVIDTITSKVVLILGRFTPERKAVLDTLREELRKRDYLPVLFDFEKPRSRSTDETVTLLARMARFVVADITDAKSVLQELRGIVPELPSVPVQPLILAPQEEPGMFDFFVGFRSVLDVHRYDFPERLIADLGERVIGPAEAKVEELRPPRAG